MIADDAKFCPNCGTPAINAPLESEKKLWERDDLKPAGPTPPPLPHYHAITSPAKKRNNMAVVMAIISVALILVMAVVWLFKHSTVSTHTQQYHETSTQPNSSSNVTITSSGNMSQAQADSLMQAAMAEMEQTDSIMQAMMASMMGADPWQQLEEGQHNMTSQPTTPQHRVRKNGVVNMAGEVGNKHMVLVLNLKEAQNVKGSGGFIVNNQKQGKLHLLGIQDGENLTVSVYNSNNRLLGTLAGLYNGVSYQGSYMVDGKETPFQLLVQ